MFIIIPALLPILKFNPGLLATLLLSNELLNIWGIFPNVEYKSLAKK
jgi:hypothetical protein